mmetsp:Transcript_880/g.2216  ORF Transcript_880/g.2216 Transcript_880/m.2216 type:complete len:957 (+) Transcript_880:121-2991(+)|eukprot:CAMPEP_0172367760 /NCGR_PEP_ID=MMETSP1060-20121228/23444_1 /TAXON_ID=37318 /ORGANISM="Pseudo-nitzschia pungens, Strain cf. cingulata" /LENGTH=956 /DNA_ID=CAMNT_0013092119 /DNA_START=115 /DNA_END=2985 /DNA_ORIENTATION=+
MSSLTKKFTRDSLKRASGGGGSIANESEDLSARARSKSMQNPNVSYRQQRRYRSLSKGLTSAHHSLGVENRKATRQIRELKVPSLSHPNEEYGQAYNEAELLTQMSSLTEPTWAPSDLGRPDLTSTYHGQSQLIQRSRTGNYNNIRRQTRFQYCNPDEHQNRATFTISTAKDRKQMNDFVPEKRDDNEGNENMTKNDTNHGDSNHGHHDRTSVGTEGIEVHRVDRDEAPEENDESTVANVDHLHREPHLSAELRDGISCDGDSPSFSRTKSVWSRSKSRSRREGDTSSASRTRGRSGRPSSDRKISRRSSSSIVSIRSAHSARTKSTTPSKASSISISSSESIISRKATTARHIVANRKTDNNEKIKCLSGIRSSSVPPTMTDSKRKQRTTSVPPTQRKKETRRSKNQKTKNGTNYNKAVAISMNGSHLNDEFTDAILDTSATVEDTTALPSQAKLQSHTIFTPSPEVSPSDCPPTPSSAAQAARMSLRPALRRSHSNRSVSSVQSESILSIASNNQKATASGRVIEQARRSPSRTPISPTKKKYASRTHKLAQDTQAKRIHEQKQQKRQERELQKKRRQQKAEEKERRKKARAAALAVTASHEEPHQTTSKTLLQDFFVFHVFLLLSIPRRLLLFFWSRTFSKNWSARHKSVLVTGANAPLASETARQFAAGGANLILVSHSSGSSEDDMELLVEECQELGSSKVRSYSADLSNAVSAELVLREAAKEFEDTFDVVILNGENESHGCLFEEIADANQIGKMVKDNTIGCIIALHYAMKYIPKTPESRIVVLSSTSGLVASPYKSVYGATQHALKGFCDSVRMELNDNYTERRSPKLCFASFPELIGHYICHGNASAHVSRMGADNPPMKTHSWAAIPMQQAVYGLLEAIALGEREFGSPRHVQVWRCLQAIAPSWADFSVFRHTMKTQYRPAEVDENLQKKKARKGDRASVSNKT